MLAPQEFIQNAKALPTLLLEKTRDDLFVCTPRREPVPQG